MGKIFIHFWFFIFYSAISFALEVTVNQAGYPTNLPKYFYCNSQADSFYIIEKSSGNIFYSNSFQLSPVNDPATGMTLYKGNFSSLTRDGEYFIKTTSGDSSFSFLISSTVYNDVYSKSLKGFYFQRCGTSLLSNNADEYHHAACHTTDGFFHSSTNSSGFSLSTGGWHDAGDYGKYVVNSGITVGTLLMAYEYFPQKFSDDNLNIPESENNIPDILDEIKYELDWLLKMQDTTNGGVYFKVTKPQFENFIMPNKDSGTRYIYQISSTATGDFAAVMARAARIFLQFDADLSSIYLTASQKAWNFLSDNISIVPQGGFTNPAGTVTGEYGDGNDNDERLWAAAELFETTGEKEYKNNYELLYSSGGIFNSTMWWGDVRSLAHLTYLFSNQQLSDQSIKTELKNNLISYCNNLLSRVNGNGFGISINPGEYSWGCNSDVLNKAILLILGYEQTDNINYFNAALAQVNYILGTNAHNLSFVTGVGTNSVNNPHHRPSAADGIENPVPGLLAGGPNQYLNDPVLQANFTNSTPPALCYIDDEGSYASNEIAINWNAPLVFAVGYFSFSPATLIDRKGLNMQPEDFRLYQNYPNPFNPKTNIGFHIAEFGFISLKVFDLLGNEVANLINEKKTAGDYEIEFNANKLSSGIYFYRLKTDNFIAGKKMILMK